MRNKRKYGHRKLARYAVTCVTKNRKKVINVSGKNSAIKRNSGNSIPGNGYALKEKFLRDFQITNLNNSRPNMNSCNCLEHESFPEFHHISYTK